MKSIEITWNLNTEPDMESYRVYENDVLIDTVLHPINKLIVTRADGSYKYQIAAVDTSKNPSPLSDPVSVVVDTIPPAIVTGLKALIKN